MDCKKEQNVLKLVFSEHKYPEIDFLKGFSILTIVVMHLIQVYMRNLPGIIYTGASLGGTGVHVFFFCSGFGLYLSQSKKCLGAKEFYGRRLKKIYVPYIIIVLISFCIPFMYQESDRIPALLSHIFLFKMFVPKYEISFGLQLWYISTIIQFYIAFPFLYSLYKKNKSSKRILLGAFFVSVCWWIFVAYLGKGEERVWNSFFLQYLWEFVLGMEVAKYLKDGETIEIKRWQLIVVAIVGLSVQMIMAMVGGNLKLFNDIPALVGYGALALFIYSLHIGCIGKVMNFVAKISYEWYLVHIVVFTCIFKGLRGYCAGMISEMAVSLIALGISLFVAYLYQKVTNRILQ